MVGKREVTKEVRLMVAFGRVAIGRRPARSLRDHATRTDEHSVMVYLWGCFYGTRKQWSSTQ